MPRIRLPTISQWTGVFCLIIFPRVLSRCTDGQQNYPNQEGRGAPIQSCLLYTSTKRGVMYVMFIYNGTLIHIYFLQPKSLFRLCDISSARYDW